MSTDLILEKTVPEALKPLAVKVLEGRRLSEAEALRLYRDAPLSVLGVLAARVKERKNGKNVFYNRNFHVEPTNICRYRCRFCSYRREPGSEDAWDYSVDTVVETAARYKGQGMTEVHIVGGVHPDRDLYYYAEMIRRIRKTLPGITVKAFSAVELDYMITSAGLSLESGLTLLKEAGMQTMPGGGAEIFNEEVRTRICPEKCSSARWLEIHRTAHRIGMPTNATMLYGHIEKVEHRIEHMSRLREVQERTGGFNAFIPLKYRSGNNDLSETGEVPVTEDLRTLALARIFLDNFDHVKAYWPMYGKTVTRMALSYGADDVDGTIGDTTKIYSMAGAEEERPVMTVAELEAMIRDAGMIPVERDSFYRPVK